jgi:hypothetical protein
MIHKILVDTVFKGALQGIGTGIVGAIGTIVKFTFSRKMMIRLLIDLCKIIANSTKTDVDDKLVASVEKELKKAGEIE